MTKPKPNNPPKDSFYKESLPSHWQTSFDKASEFPFDALVEEAFYIAHSRIQYLLQHSTKFSKQAQMLIDIAEAMSDPNNESIPEDQKLSPKFVYELKLILSGLSPDQLIRNFNATVALADGAQRLAVNGSGNVLRQLDICKSLLIQILKYSNDKPTKELVLSAIAQLKLEGGLPVSEFQTLIDRVMLETVDHKNIEQVIKANKKKLKELEKEQERLSEESQQAPLEGDIWNNED